MKPALSPVDDPTPDPQAVYAVGELIAAVRELAVRAEAATRGLHAADRLTVAERGLLLALRRRGPLTIPQLAREKGASRQYVQQALKGPQARGLVDWRENPRHRRSRLAALTPAGDDLLRRVMRREGDLLRRLAVGVDRQAVTAAVARLHELEANLLRDASG